MRRLIHHTNNIPLRFNYRDSLYSTKDSILTDIRFLNPQKTNIYLDRSEFSLKKYSKLGLLTGKLLDYEYYLFGIVRRAKRPAMYWQEAQYTIALKGMRLKNRNFNVWTKIKYNRSLILEKIRS